VSDRLIPLGKIVTTHGVLGWLKLNPYNPETTLLRNGRKIIVEKNGTRSDVDLVSSRRQGRQIILKLGGVDSIDAGREFVGSTVSVMEDQLEPLAAGEYYQYQVVGVEVFDNTGARIGVITGIWSTAGGEIYVVQGAEKEHLIPAVKEIIEIVDLKTRKIIINPPPGLLDL
jgi:16S rRNA processing protein RimM